MPGTARLSVELARVTYNNGANSHLGPELGVGAQGQVSTMQYLIAAFRA